MTRDELVEQCLAAEGLAEVLDVLRQGVRDGIDPGDDDEPFAEWHRSERRTIQRLLWPPGFTVMPHDHGGLWAAVAVLQGVEENHWLRPQAGRLVAAGGRAFEEGEVVSMGPDGIHSIRNPRFHEWAVTIHVYGGDLQAAPRRGWDGDDYDSTVADYPARVASEFFAAVSAARQSTN